MTRRIFLSTPLRDEMDNIDRLFSAVGSQDYPIDLWVIVENGSTDGSREKLAAIEPPTNVKELVVLNEDTEKGEYALGSKYARVVNRGFEEIKVRRELGDEDLIGILDADSFPDLGYYRTLAEAFDSDAKIGIAGGTSVEEDGRETIHAADWVRGSCRLWRGACMKQSGYIVGPSADTLSLGRAELDGWKSKVVEEASFRAREVGTRSKQQYYGASTYYRGHTVLYALLFGSKFVRRGQMAEARAFWRGYFGAMKESAPRLEDTALRAHFRRTVPRKLKKRLGLAA